MEEREERRVREEWESEHRKTQREVTEIAQLDAQIESLKQRLRTDSSSDFVQTVVESEE